MIQPNKLKGAVDASLKFEEDIAAFAQRHWAQKPWVKGVAALTI